MALVFGPNYLFQFVFVFHIAVDFNEQPAINREVGVVLIDPVLGAQAANRGKARVKNKRPRIRLPGRFGAVDAVLYGPPRIRDSFHATHVAKNSVEGVL